MEEQSIAEICYCKECGKLFCNNKEVYMTTSNVLLLIVLWYEKNFFSVVSFLLHTKYLLPVFGLLSSLSLARCTTADIFVRIFIASSLYRDN